MLGCESLETHIAGLPRGTPPWQWPKKGQMGRNACFKES